MSKFILKIDNRENNLFNKIKSLNPLLNIQSIQLPIGDIIISNEKEDIIIIERKTIHDLQASIRDGRYEEQSYRLNGLPNHNHNIIYLIEGDINKLNTFIKVDKSALYSSMFSLNYYKGFSLFRSTSLDETASIICNMIFKLEKETNKGTKVAFYSNSVQEQNNTIQQTCEIQNVEIQNDKSYVNFAKKIKKENITQENIGEIMLCQIPGISSVTALAVISKFKSISNLIKEINANPNCLKDISYITTKGQPRKISATCINNIIKYLQ
jgi:ERCC4-type nuclease